MGLAKRLARWCVCIMIYLVLFILGIRLLPFDENWWWYKVSVALYGWLGDGEEAETNTEFLVMLLQISYVVIFIVFARLAIKYAGCIKRKYSK